MKDLSRLKCPAEEPVHWLVPIACGTLLDTAAYRDDAPRDDPTLQMSRRGRSGDDVAGYLIQEILP